MMGIKMRVVYFGLLVWFGSITFGHTNERCIDERTAAENEQRIEWAMDKTTTTKEQGIAQSDKIQAAIRAYKRCLKGQGQ